MADPLVAVDVAAEPDSAVLHLDHGPVFLEVAVLPMIDVDWVWEPLAELHEAALGGRVRGAASGLTSDESFEAWSRTTLGLEGYLRGISPDAAATVLDSATDYAEFARDLQGLDAVYLSALASAGRDLNGTFDSLERAAAMLDDVGMPGVPGGGAAHTLLSNAAVGRAALVDHQSLTDKIEAAHDNPFTVVDVLAREALGLAADASRHLIPGSGIYVREIGGVIVSTGEGIAWGAAGGTQIGGAIAGPAGAGVGAVAGAIVGGIIEFFSSLASAVSHLVAGDAAKGEKVPVSPPAPVTDTHGHTTNVNKDGHSAPGRPTGSGDPHPPPPGHTPGPKAKEAHCPRGDDEAILPLELLGWRDQFDLMATVQPHGSGFDGLFAEATAIALPAPSQVSFAAEVADPGIWGDLMIERAGPGERGPAVIDAGRITAVGEATRRVLLAQALTEYAAPGVTIDRAVAAMVSAAGRTGHRR